MRFSSYLVELSTRKRAIMRAKTKAQALVEMALVSTLLAVLLGGAVDLGRAYYTAVVVENMAAEGAAYASIHPDKDVTYPTAGSCSRFSITSTDKNTIQNRARRVAINRGLIISNLTVNDISILDGEGATSACSTRCAGTTITVKVTYRITDLFILGVMGRNEIVVSKTASQRLMNTAYAAQDTCTP